MPNVLSQLKLNKIPVKDLVPESGTTAPASPGDGQLWNDTSTSPSQLKRWNGTSWVLTGTNYTTGTTAEITTGTDTNPKVWTPKGLKDALTKANVGLPNVDNTSDAAKPISTATQTALNAKADSASPTFTGDPKAPTPAAGDNDTSIATTAFVQTAIGPKANLASPNFTGTPTAPTPTTGTGIANKDYVDGLIQGIDNKYSAHAATTGNIALTGLQTIDGVILVAGDIVLVKDQTTASANGLYVAAAGAWVRSTNADSWAELVSAFTFVEEGTNQKDTGWVSTADAGGTLGTTPIVWTQFSSAGIVLAGTGLTKVGNTISIANGGVGTTQQADLSTTTAKLADGAVTTAKLADANVTTAKLADGAVSLNGPKVVGTLPISAGGTGGSSAMAARMALSAVGGYTLDIPALTAGVWLPMGSTNTNVTDMPSLIVKEKATGETVIMDTMWDGELAYVRADVSIAAGLYTLTMTQIAL